MAFRGCIYESSEDFLEILGHCLALFWAFKVNQNEITVSMIEGKDKWTYNQYRNDHKFSNR